MTTIAASRPMPIRHPAAAPPIIPPSSNWSYFDAARVVGRQSGGGTFATQSRHLKQIQKHIASLQPPTPRNRAPHARNLHRLDAPIQQAVNRSANGWLAYGSLIAVTTVSQAVCVALMGASFGAAIAGAAIGAGLLYLAARPWRYGEAKRLAQSIVDDSLVLHTLQVPAHALMAQFSKEVDQDGRFTGTYTVRILNTGSGSRRHHQEVGRGRARCSAFEVRGVSQNQLTAEKLAPLCGFPFARHLTTAFIYTLLDFVDCSFIPSVLLSLATLLGLCELEMSRIYSWAESIGQVVPGPVMQATQRSSNCTYKSTLAMLRSNTTNLEYRDFKRTWLRQMADGYEPGFLARLWDPGIREALEVKATRAEDKYRHYAAGAL